jgi:hypothetical protein
MQAKQVGNGTGLHLAQDRAAILDGAGVVAGL